MLDDSVGQLKALDRRSHLFFHFVGQLSSPYCLERFEQYRTAAAFRGEGAGGVAYSFVACLSH